MKMFPTIAADPDMTRPLEAEPLSLATARLPAMSFDAFAVTDQTRAALTDIQGSRHLSRVQSRLFQGGLAAAQAAYAQSESPDLLIIEVDCPDADLFLQIDALANVCRMETDLILIGPSNDISLYRSLTRQGVSDYLQTPITAPLLLTALFDRRLDPDKLHQGRVHAVISARGGAGASTVAQNLAWMMGEQARAKSILADLDFDFGTASIYLNRPAEQDILSALGCPEKLDDQKLERLLIAYDDNLRLLAGPMDPTGDAALDPEHLSHAADILRVLAPHVVLDLPTTLSPVTRQALFLADDLVIVATPDLASLRNTRTLIDLIRTLRPGEQTPRLVLNQVAQPKRPEIKPADFVKALDLPAPVVLNFDAAKFGTAVNSGALVVQNHPNRAQRQAFETLADQLGCKAQKKKPRTPMALFRRNKG